MLDRHTSRQPVAGAGGSRRPRAPSGVLAAAVAALSLTAPGPAAAQMADRPPGALADGDRSPVLVRGESRWRVGRDESGDPSAEGAAGSPYAGAAQALRTYPLERAVEIGLRNNRQLRVAELDLEAADKQVREAYGALFPEIEATASMQRNLLLPEAFLPAIIFDPDAAPGELVPVTFGADNQWSAGVSLSQKLFDATVFIGVGAAGKVRDLNREALRASAQQVATAIRLAYLNALLADEQVRVTQNSIERVERTLEETRALNRAGLASDYDVLRLEVQLANIRPNLRRSENQLAEAARLLAIEMGLAEVEPVGTEGQLHLMDLEQRLENSLENRVLLGFAGQEDAEQVAFDELLSIALRQRSDLRQVRVQHELEQVQVKVARTELYPRLEGFLNWSLIAQENGALNFYGENADQRTTTAAVGVQLEIPVFEGGRRFNRIQQREISVRQVEQQLADRTQRAENEVRSVLDQLTEARARAEAQRRAVGEAQRGFDIVTAEYLAGTSERLEVTEAELALRQAELNYAQAVYDYLVAQARLDLAVGTVPIVDRVVTALTGADSSPDEPGGEDSPGRSPDSPQDQEERPGL